LLPCITGTKANPISSFVFSPKNISRGGLKGLLGLPAELS
jgi:hypothetical protein